MKTNREKYDHICGQIAAKDQAAIAALLPDGVPIQFHTIEQYEARPIDVTSVQRHRRGFYIKAGDARVTRQDLQEANAVLDNWTMPALDDLFVFYSYKQTYGIVSGAYPYQKIGGDVTLAWDADALAPEIERRRELYAPREGHEPCAYCRKQTPSASTVSGTIYYRDRGGLAQKTCRYCSPTCHGHDQMGHEG
ncbi:YdaE family protein [Massilia sp. TN1-12]|uniref:YdaE family protein n=1 Tax=Massilia paldalensis TaxID=3377675 RepID=UPI00384E7D77